MNQVRRNVPFKYSAVFGHSGMAGMIAKANAPTQFLHGQLVIITVMHDELEPPLLGMLGPEPAATTGRTFVELHDDRRPVSGRRPAALVRTRRACKQYGYQSCGSHAH